MASIMTSFAETASLIVYEAFRIVYLTGKCCHTDSENIDWQVHLLTGRFRTVSQIFCAVLKDAVFLITFVLALQHLSIKSSVLKIRPICS